MKASIIATGTEITRGLTLNTNANHLSKILSELGIDVNYHVAVPDNEELILQALHLSQDCDIIITTGGLGPTSDDITRTVVCKFANEPVTWNDEQWNILCEKQKTRGRQAKELHKQQCLFPSTAIIINNSVGTANGFYFLKNKNHFFVLPGPPNEIQSLLDNGFMNKFTELSNLNPDQTHSKTWTTIGTRESQIAEWLKPIEEKYKELNIGYRINLPEIEVRLLYKKSQKNIAEACSEEIGQALKNILVKKF